MLKFRHVVPAAFLSAGALAPVLAAPADGDGVAQLRAFVKDVQSAQGRFVQTVTSPDGKRARKSEGTLAFQRPDRFRLDRKSTRLNSSHMSISYAVFCL